DPAFLLGTRLFPAATRSGEGPSGRRVGSGMPMAPHPLSVLAEAHAVRGVCLSPSAPQPGGIIAPPPCPALLKNRKNTLTAPLRACVRFSQSPFPIAGGPAPCRQSQDACEGQPNPARESVPASLREFMAILPPRATPTDWPRGPLVALCGVWRCGARDHRW